MKNQGSIEAKYLEYLRSKRGIRLGEIDWKILQELQSLRRETETSWRTATVTDEMVSAYLEAQFLYCFDADRRGEVEYAKKACAAGLTAAMNEFYKGRIDPKPAQDRYEVIECPVCKGKLHLSQSSYNGHVHGKCETKGCVSWME